MLSVSVKYSLKNIDVKAESWEIDPYCDHMVNTSEVFCYLLHTNYHLKHLIPSLYIMYVKYKSAK